MSWKIRDKKHWLSRAEEARAEAETMPTAKARREMLKIADAYERIADHYGRTTTRK